MLTLGVTLIFIGVFAAVAVALWPRQQWTTIASIQTEPPKGWPQPNAWNPPIPLDYPVSAQHPPADVDD